MFRRLLSPAALVVTAFFLTACASSSTPTLSEAFCNDLQGGATLFQIYGGVQDQYTPDEFADSAYGMAAISCPDELASNIGLRSYLEAWDINPDA
jgi:hypothetical protein